MRRKSAEKNKRHSLKIQLTSTLQRTFDAFTHLLDASRHRTLQFRILLAQAQQLIGHVQGRHDGDAIRADDFSSVADLAHLLVEVLGGVEQIGAFIGGAGNEIFLLEDAYGDVRRFFLAHAVCSMVLSRPIMASTRARTWSLRCAKAERSAVSDSCLCRRARFSSLRASIVRRSSSTRRSRRTNSPSKLVLADLLFSLVVSFMAQEYGAEGGEPAIEGPAPAGVGHNSPMTAATYDE